MSKLKVVLIAGGVVAVAGFVYRKPLRAVAGRYGDYAHGFVTDMAEQLVQLRQNQVQKAFAWKDDGAVDSFLTHPETGEVRTRPDAQ
jgi:hypothetical protein